MNKKLITGLLIGLFLAGGIILAAPVGTVLRSVIPENNAEFYLGTTSPRTYWKNIYTNTLTVTNGTATTTLNAGDSLATFAYPFTGISSTLNATTSGLRIASSTVLGSLNIGTLTATSGTSFINSLTIGDTLTVTGLTLTTLTVNGASTLSTTTVQGYFNTGIIVATSSIKTNNFTVTGTLSLPVDSVTNAMVSDTLTASDLVAGSSVVSNAEVDNDLTISAGVIDNTIIGGTTAAAGTFTNLYATASSTISKLWISTSATTSELYIRGRFASAFASSTGATSITLDANVYTDRIILEGNTDIILNSTSSSPTDGARIFRKIQQGGAGTYTINWASNNNLFIDGNGATTTIPTGVGSCLWVLFVYESRISKWTNIASTTGLLNRCN